MYPETVKYLTNNVGNVEIILHELGKTPNKIKMEYSLIVEMLKFHKINMIDEAIDMLAALEKS